MYNIDNFKETWQKVQELVFNRLNNEEDKYLFDKMSPEELKSILQLKIDDHGLSLKDVLSKMEKILDATPSSSNPRFLNQLFGGRETAAVIADIMCILSNSSMYTFKAAGAQILIENEVLMNMCEKAGFINGEGAFMPGGSLANLAAMVLARHKQFPNARDNGFNGIKPTFYTSAESHYSIRKNAGIIGVGRNAVRYISVDKDGQMIVSELKKQINEDKKAGYTPFFINATAGTTVRGAFDPIDQIADVAETNGIWLHVDGALGGTLLLSDRHKQKLKGSSRADSLSWNPHKMMGMSLQTSVLLTKEKGHLVQSFDEAADYLFQCHSDEFNPGHRSLQCGRRNDAFRLWAAWIRLGNKGWEERVNLQMSLAQEAASMIKSDSRMHLFEDPCSINVCFNVKGHDPKIICEKLNEKGTLKIGYGAISSENYIRLVCINPTLKKTDLKWIFNEILSVTKYQ